MSEQVIEKLKAVLSKSSPDFLVDADGNVLHHDMKTGQLHMIEVRAFDVTEVPHIQRTRMLAGEVVLTRDAVNSLNLLPLAG